MHNNRPMHALLFLLALAATLCGLAAKISAAEPPTSALCRIYVDAGFDQLGRKQGYAGSGTLVNVAKSKQKGQPRGLVLTCAHTFDHLPLGERLSLMFCDGKQEYIADLIGLDRPADLAALEIARPPTKVVKWIGVTPRHVEMTGFGGEGALRMIRGEVFNQYEDSLGRPSQLAMRGSARQGDSGGGIFDAHGQLVGVLNRANAEMTIFTRAEQVAAFLARFGLKPTGAVPASCKPCQVQVGLINRPAGGGCYQTPGGEWRCPQPQQPNYQQPSYDTPRGGMQQPFDPRPQPGSPYGVAGGGEGCECDGKWDALDQWKSGVDSAIADLKLGTAAAKAAADAAASGAVHKDDLDEYAKADQVEDLAEATEEGHKTLLDRIRTIGGAAKAAVGKAKDVAGVVDQATSPDSGGGVLAGLGWGKLIAGALGIGGPPGIAIAIGSSLILRQLKKRRRTSSGGSSRAAFR